MRRRKKMRKRTLENRKRRRKGAERKPILSCVRGTRAHPDQWREGALHLRCARKDPQCVHLGMEGHLMRVRRECV